MLRTGRPFQACVFFTLLLAACGQPPASKQQATPEGPHFQFSKAAPVPRNEEKGNWCRIDYPEAIPIQADAADFNRRFFLIGEGLYKVNIHAGNATSSFVLQRGAEEAVVLHTGLHFPGCLSTHRNFVIGTDGFTRYDNRHNIQYTMHLQYSPAAGTFVVIDLPKNAGYGLTVHRAAVWE